MPVLVIAGDDDRVVPTTDSVRLAEAVPNAKLVRLSNCGHLPQEECPAAFLEAVHRALDLYRQPAQWRRLQQTGMRQYFDWSDSAGHYLELYSL